MLRRITSSAVLVVVASALAIAPPSSARAADGNTTSGNPGNGNPANGRDPVSLAQQRLDAARTQATEIAGRIAAAQTQQAQLVAQIADAEARIPVLRAKATELRAQVKARAAQLYVLQSSTTAFDSTMDAESTEDGLRAAHLTDTIGAHDLEAATELKDTAARLAEREAQLKVQRADLERTIAQLTPLNDLLQQKLRVATALYEKVRALVVDGVAKHGVDVATDATECPVRGFVVFTDDFGELRPGGPHGGIDMPAVAETPVVAVANGFWRRDIGGDGGNGAWLTGVDKVSYYYAHFSRYSDTPEGFVKAGDVIGYVGSTGHSTGPHLHFEIHPGLPGERPPVDPFATLLALCNDIPRATPN